MSNVYYSVIQGHAHKKAVERLQNLTMQVRRLAVNSTWPSLSPESRLQHMHDHY